MWSLLLVALVTLTPFEFRWPARLRLTWGFAPFELPLMGIVYLAALTAWPLHDGGGHWTAGIGIPEIGAPPSLEALYRLVEHFAAFTLGGYLVAESLGRREEQVLRSCARVVLSFTALAAALELVRAHAPDSGASVLRAGRGVMGAALGAIIYRRQASALRRWAEWGGSATPSEQSCSQRSAFPGARMPAPASSIARAAINRPAADAATR